MRTALAGLLLIITSNAHASSLPRYDVRSWCDRVASAAGSRSEVLYGGCIAQEQLAYNRLQGVTLDGHTLDWCGKVATSAGSGSYSLFAGCADMEASARSQNAATTFKY